MLICLRPPPLLGFCLWWSSNFVGSEAGQTPADYGLLQDSTRAKNAWLSSTCLLYALYACDKLLWILLVLLSWIGVLRWGCEFAYGSRLQGRAQLPVFSKPATEHRWKMEIKRPSKREKNSMKYICYEDLSNKKIVLFNSIYCDRLLKWNFSSRTRVVQCWSLPKF